VSNIFAALFARDSELWMQRLIVVVTAAIFTASNIIFMVLVLTICYDSFECSLQFFV